MVPPFEKNLWRPFQRSALFGLYRVLSYVSRLVPASYLKERCLCGILVLRVSRILFLWMLNKITKSGKFSPHENLIVHELTFAHTFFFDSLQRTKQYRFLLSLECLFSNKFRWYVQSVAAVQNSRIL